MAPKTILLVEDNPLNMKLAVDLLEYGGFRVVRATSGVHALEYLSKEPPDLILLDIRLPDMDGFEILQRIRSQKRLENTRVVAMTAQGMREEKAKITDAGFDGYILKPFVATDFVDNIHKILSGQKEYFP
jgi:CheY-like chemotaxis protein